MALNFGKEAKETTKELQDEIKKLEPVPEDKLKELLPKRVDQEELKALIEAVNKETEKNKKIAVFNELLGQASVVVKDVAEKLFPVALKAL